MKFLQADVLATPTAITGSSARMGLDKAKDHVPFLLESAQDPTDDNKVYEFWQIWSESIPPVEELVEGVITFEVATSADMEKLSWRTSGPQTIFIQRMVLVSFCAALIPLGRLLLERRCS